MKRTIHPLTHNDRKHRIHIENLDSISLAQMASFFAHEVRNPLTAISGFTNLLLQNNTVKNDPMMKKYLSIIEEESNRMHEVIKEFLYFSSSSLTLKNLETINIKDCIESVLSTYRILALERKIKVLTTIPANLYVYAISYHLERVFINLIKNAIESIERHGTIYITATTDENDVTISFIDSGPGIPDDTLPIVFQPFFTTKEEGTGIGLSLCKTIIESYYGTIEVNNHPPLGAHFKIVLPKKSILKNEQN